MCRLALPGVRTGLGLQELFALRVHSHWGRTFLVGERGIGVPLVARADSLSVSAGVRMPWLAWVELVKHSVPPINKQVIRLDKQ